MAPVRLTSPDGMTPEEQLDGIGERVRDLIERQSAIFITGTSCPRLPRPASSIVNAGDLSKADHRPAQRGFSGADLSGAHPARGRPGTPVSVHLQPLAQPRGDGPRPARHQPRFARVKVPPLLPRFIGLPDGQRFVPLEQVIALHLPALFPGMEIVSNHFFRVTRDADLDVDDDEAEDLMAAVQAELTAQAPKGTGSPSRGRPRHVP